MAQPTDDYSDLIDYSAIESQSPDGSQDYSDLTANGEPSAVLIGSRQPKSKAASALQGFGSGASLGFLPWLQARVGQGLEGVRKLGQGEFSAGLSEIAEAASDNPFNRMVKGAIIGVPPEAFLSPEGQRQNRDFQEYDKSAQQDNPLTYLGARLFGAGMAGAATPAARAATVAGRIGQSALTGAGIGAAEGIGESVSRDSTLGETTKQTAFGATIGGALGGGVSAVGEGIRGLATGVGLRALGADKAAIRGLRKSKINPEELVDEAREAGILGAFVGTDRAQSAARNLVAQRAAATEALESELGEAGARVYARNVLPALRVEAENARGTLAPEAYANALDEIAQKAQSIFRSRNAQQTGLSLTEADEVLKRPLGDWKAKALASRGDPAANTQAMSDAYSIIRQQIEKAADRAGEGMGEALRQSNKSTQKALMLREFLDERAAREGANRLVGLSEQIGGGAGMAVGALTGNPIAGSILGGAASRFGRGPFSRAAGAYGQPLGRAVSRSGGQSAGALSAPPISAVREQISPLQQYLDMLPAEERRDFSSQVFEEENR